MSGGRLGSAKRNMIANYLGRIWSALMGLAFIPVYTKLMGVEAMGVVGLFVTLQAFCMLLDAGLSTTLNREMARMSNEPGKEQEMRNLLRTFEGPFWAASLVGGGLVVLLAPFLAHQWVNVGMLSPAAVEQAIRLMGVVLFLQLPLSLYAGGLLGLQRQVEYSGLTAAWYTLRFAGVVGALKIFGGNLTTFFVWQVAVAGLATALSAALLWKYLPRAPERARFDRRLFEGRWQFAAGLGGISVTLLLLNNVDKVILTKLVSLEAFGYYTLAWSLANAVRLLADPVYLTFFPRLSQAWAAEDRSAMAHLYHQVCRFMSLAIVPFALTIAFFASEALLVWTRSPEMVANTTALLRWLAVGNLFLALAIVPYALQLASGWTSLALWSNLVASIVLVPLMAVLATNYGTLGGGIAWVLLNGGYLAATVALMHRRLLTGHAIDWAVNDVGRTVVPVLLALALLRFSLPTASTPLAALLALTLSFVVAQGVAVAVSPLSYAIRGRLMSLVRKRRPA